LDSFEERSRFSTWIYRIATNEALMRLRKAHRKREVFLDDSLGKGEKWFAEEIRDFSRSALEELLDAEKIELLQQALAEVPEEYRVVFTLRDIEGLSNAEVAEVLDLSVPAVKSRLHRCRVYLRDRLSLLLGEGKAARSGEEKQQR
jgi:RNA polymerase sigma-70 factor (ECF subfamily)